jgi:hypothetical protein
MNRNALPFQFRGGIRECIGGDDPSACIPV